MLPWIEQLLKEQEISYSIVDESGPMRTISVDMSGQAFRKLNMEAKSLKQKTESRMPWLPVLDYGIIRSPRRLRATLSKTRSAIFAVLWCDEKWVTESDELKRITPKVEEVSKVLMDNTERMTEWMTLKNSDLLCIVSKNGKKNVCYVFDEKSFKMAFVF